MLFHVFFIVKNAAHSVSDEKYEKCVPFWIFDTLWVIWHYAPAMQCNHTRLVVFIDSFSKHSFKINFRNQFSEFLKSFEWYSWAVAYINASMQYQSSYAHLLLQWAPREGGCIQNRGRRYIMNISISVSVVLYLALLINVQYRRALTLLLCILFITSFLGFHRLTVDNCSTNYFHPS